MFGFIGLSVVEDELRKKEDCVFVRLVYDVGIDAKEGCFYFWVILLEKWL